jgi:hypothetical protein
VRIAYDMGYELEHIRTARRLASSLAHPLMTGTTCCCARRCCYRHHSIKGTTRLPSEERTDRTSSSNDNIMPPSSPLDQTQPLPTPESTHPTSLDPRRQAGHGAGAGGRPCWLECDICVEKKRVGFANCEKSLCTWRLAKCLLHVTAAT